MGCSSRHASRGCHRTRYRYVLREKDQGRLITLRGAPNTTLGNWNTRRMTEDGRISSVLPRLGSSKHLQKVMASSLSASGSLSTGCLPPAPMGAVGASEQLLQSPASSGYFQAVPVSWLSLNDLSQDRDTPTPISESLGPQHLASLGYKGS